MQSGNWCEGLTAYLADHLVQEQRGLGADYRRNALQKYRNYVQAGTRFPTQGVSRTTQCGDRSGGVRQSADDVPHDAAADRRRRVSSVHWPGSIGNSKGKRASFADLREEFEAAWHSAI